MPWRLTVRAGSRVEHLTFSSLLEALDAAEGRAGEVSEAGRKRPVDMKYKRFDPIHQVAARIELAGPERLLPSVRAGLDVRGDGSTEAFMGRIRRQVIEPHKGESAYGALRRTLQAHSTNVAP